MDTNDSQPFSVDDLDDAVWGGDTPTTDESTLPLPTQADEESAGDEEQGRGPAIPAPAPAAGQQDDGPGNLRVALKEERAQRQALQAQFSQLQSQIAAQHQREQQAAYEARLRQDLSQLDPDDVPAYLQAEQQRRRSETQASVQRQTAQQALVMSEQFARVHLPDYDQQITKLLGGQGTPSSHASALAQWASTQLNPAMAIYDLAKGLHTPAEVDALVEARVQERLADATSRFTQPRKAQPSTPRLGSMPAASKPAPASHPMQGLSKGLNAPVGSDTWHDTVNKLFEMTADQ